MQALHEFCHLIQIHFIHIIRIKMNSWQQKSAKNKDSESPFSRKHGIEQRTFEALIKRQSLLLSNWKKIKMILIQSPHRELLMAIKASKQTRIEEILNITHSRLANNFSNIDDHHCFGIVIPSKKKYYFAGKTAEETISLFANISKLKKDIRSREKLALSKNTVDQSPKEIIEETKNYAVFRSQKNQNALMNESSDSQRQSSQDKSYACHYNPTSTTKLQRQMEVEESFYTAIEQKHSDEHQQQQQYQYHEPYRQQIDTFQKKSTCYQNLACSQMVLCEQMPDYYQIPTRKQYAAWEQQPDFRQIKTQQKISSTQIFAYEQIPVRQKTLLVEEPISFQEVKCLESDEGFKLLLNFEKGRLLIKNQKFIKASILSTSLFSPRRLLQSFFHLELWNETVKDYKFVNRLGKGVYLTKLELHKKNFFSLPKYCYMMVYTCKVKEDYAVVFRSLEEAHFQKQFGYTWIKMNLWTRVSKSTKKDQQIINICGSFETVKDYEEGLLFLDGVKMFEVFLQTIGELPIPILEWSQQNHEIDIQQI